MTRNKRQKLDVEREVNNDAVIPSFSLLEPMEEVLVGNVSSVIKVYGHIAWRWCKKGEDNFWIDVLIGGSGWPDSILIDSEFPDVVADPDREDSTWRSTESNRFYVFDGRMHALSLTGDFIRTYSDESYR